MLLPLITHSTIDVVYGAESCQLQVAVKLYFHYSMNQNKYVMGSRMVVLDYPNDQSNKKATQTGC